MASAVSGKGSGGHTDGVSRASSIRSGSMGSVTRALVPVAFWKDCKAVLGILVREQTQVFPVHSVSSLHAV